MLRAGFEPATPMFERPKTVLALDRAAVETGLPIKQQANGTFVTNGENPPLTLLMLVSIY
jgi:hypothetical protein